MIIGIIGGTHGIGVWFARLFSSKGFSVLVSGRKTTLSNIDLAKKSDIVIIAVPIRATRDVIREILPHLKEGALLADFTSIKKAPLEEMKKAKESVGVVGLHPLFGPLVSSLNNQRIITCTIKPNKWWWRLKQFFQQEGAILIEMDPEEHDKAMAFVQGATHIINLLWGEVVKETHNKYASLHTPTYLIQSYLLGRITSQRPELISDILAENKEVEGVVNKTKEIAFLLEKAIKKKDKAMLEKMFLSLKSKWGKERAESALVTTKLLDHLVKQKTPDNQSLTIVFLGPVGTYSHLAALKWKELANITANLIPKPTIKDLFLSSLNNTLAVVPAENKIEGYVNQTFDLLAETKVVVNTSFKIPIHHALLSKSKNISSIKHIISHPQALAQCRNWIEEHCPHCILEPSSSTTSAIEKYLDREDVGFIASSHTAQIYGLNILAENISDEKGNETEFYILSSSPLPNIKPTPTKSLFIMSIYDRKAVLRDILNVFAEYDINLTKIFSRPSRTKAWDYLFFIEAETNADKQLENEIVKACSPLCPFIKVAGNTSSKTIPFL